MLLERPMPVHAAGVSDDLAPGHRASSGFSEARFFEASGHTVLIGHPKLKPDAIIAVSCRSSRTTQFQTAESPQNSGRFNEPSFEPDWGRSRLPVGRFQAIRSARTST